MTKDEINNWRLLVVNDDKHVKHSIEGVLLEIAYQLACMEETQRESFRLANKLAGFIGCAAR